MLFTSTIRYYLIIILSFNLCLLNSSFAGDKSNKLNKINIEITSHLGDKQSFVEGDVIKFLINLDIDAYITVIYKTADGKLIQLVPNLKEPHRLYKAGLFISVPSTNAPYQFSIQAPYGKETVWVFASDKLFKELKGTKLSNGLRILTSSIEDIKKRIKLESINYFGLSYFELKTRKR